MLGTEIDKILEDQNKEQEEMEAEMDSRIENSDLTWPEKFQQMLYLNFIPSDSDLYPTYKYGKMDSCSITSLSPSY